VLQRHTLAQGLVRRAWLRLRRDYDGDRWARIVAGTVASIGDEDGERGAKDTGREGRE
jgi:hypothetical protein